MTNDNRPAEEKLTNAPIERIKEYGKRSLSPLLEVVQKYQSDLGPYVAALHKGLSAAEGALSAEASSPQEKFVGNWFRQIGTTVNEFKDKWQETNYEAVAAYLEDEVKRRPGLMFSVSYLVGLGIGRFGRHMGHAVKVKKNEATFH